MKIIRLFFSIMTLLVLSSCFHLHIAKVPKKYIHSVEKNLDELTQMVLGNYQSNVTLKADSVKEETLRNKMHQLRIDYIILHFQNDSSIIFGHTRKASLPDTWQTDKEVTYYFGVAKPHIVSKKGDFSDITLKLNDSMVFNRYHSPGFDDK